MKKRPHVQSGFSFFYTIQYNQYKNHNITFTHNLRTQTIEDKIVCVALLFSSDWFDTGAVVNAVFFRHTQGLFT
jgi:hypothetical protein